MPRLRHLAVSLLLGLVSFSPAFAQRARQQAPAVPALDASALKAMVWREIGPYRGGRADSIVGLPSQRDVYYFGSCGGGVWKTTDAGVSWKNVTDGFFGGSVGAVAVAETDPNIVFAGTGEKTVRGNVTHGEGVWKSTDAGKTWTHVGLSDSRHIGRIRIHPTDPDLVYVAAMGHLFGPNQQRGVYRSRDGGKNWSRVLFVNADAGAVDLILDPSNPRTLFASTWRFRRTPYSFESGGEGSALWKSTDGGDTWVDLSTKKGMPKGTLGIIGVTVSPSNPQNVYAIIEAAEGGVFRSRDGGDTWTKVSSEAELRQRAWYYSRIYADPKDQDTVYVLNVRFHKSKDGGKSWTAIPTPHSDNHDLWIDPNDPLRMGEVNDGGANISNDGGETWTRQDNQPTSQIYRVSVDNDFPYRLLGGQQDNSTLRIRHRSTSGSIGARDWEPTAGGESGYVVAHPRNPDLVFGGSYNGFLHMVNHRTGQSRDVNPWPDTPMGWGAAELKHRFQWNFPILFSRHDPDHLYTASQFLLESKDAGSSWKVISPDLTRNDKSKQGPSGGPITKDNTSVEYYDTIFAVAESPLRRGVLWVGTDDGLVHVSQDGGATWANVTPRDMPQWIMVNAIDASPFDPATAYVAATMYKSDDFRPYLYRTSDYGKTWTKITDGIPATHFTRVVRTDTKRKGLLFAGTESGMYVSFDDGAKWQSLQLKLPVTPITDLVVNQDALIASTNGRGFWILDDLEPLRQLSPDVQTKSAHLFAPPQAWRMDAPASRRPPRFEGTNPPPGVIVDFLLRDQKPGTKVSLAFLGADGKVIREYKGEVQKEAPKAREIRATDVASETATAAQPPRTEGVKSEGGEAERTGGEPAADASKDEDKLENVVNGHNRFAWNLRYPDTKKFEGMVLWGGGTTGPMTLPGTYQVRLTVGDQVQTQSFEVKQDPRTTASSADLKAQFDFIQSSLAKLSEVNESIKRIREVRKQLTDLKKRAGDSADGKAIAEAATALDKKMTAVEEALYQTKNKSPQDPLNYPIRLNDKLAGVADSAAEGFHAPTAQHRAVRDEVVGLIDTELAKLKAIWDVDLPAFNQKAAGLPAVK